MAVPVIPKIQLPVQERPNDLQSMVLWASGKGLASVTLPAGTYLMDKPLFIPGGTEDFTIEATDVVLKQAAYYTGPLLVAGHGARNFDGTNSSLPNWSSRIQVNALSDRNASGLTLDASTAVTAGYYVLTDGTQTVYPLGQGSATGDVKRELVYVTTSGTASSVDFGRQPRRIVDGGIGQGNMYGSDAVLVDVNEFVSRNITIVGLTLDGSNVTGGYANYLSNLCFIDGLTLTDCNAQYFLYEGFTTLFCRNVLRDGGWIRYSNANVAGEGYADADYAVYNTETKNRTYLDTGSSSQGIRHLHYTAYGVSNKWQHDIAAHNTLDSMSTPVIEVASHVGPDNDCLCERVYLSGTARGVGWGGHTLFGYGSTRPIVRDVDANQGDMFLNMDTTNAYAFNVQNVNKLWIAGAGGRTAWHAGAVPAGPTTPTDIEIENCSIRKIATSAGFEAGELRFAGTFHLHDSQVINIDSTSAAIFLQTKVNATVRLEDNRVEDAASLNRPVNLDGQSGASVTLHIHDNYIELTTTTNEREALDLVGAGTVSACSGNTFNRNATPSFMRDAGGTWTGEGDYDTIFL
jgi:hypothetical protein